MDTLEIVSRLRSCLSDILPLYPVNLAYLYGSAASGRDTPLSDIDIALVLNQAQFNPNDRLKHELQLEDVITQHCDLPKDLDVRILNDAPIMVRGEVVTNGILLYSRDEDFRIDFETYTRMAYFDFQPVAAFHQKAFFERLSQRGQNGQPRQDSQSAK